MMASRAFALAGTHRAADITEGDSACLEHGQSLYLGAVARSRQ